VEPAVFGWIEVAKGNSWQMKKRPSSPVRMRLDRMGLWSEVTQVLEDQDRRGHKAPLKAISWSIPEAKVCPNCVGWLKSLNAK
jgi:hypothetical protein